MFIIDFDNTLFNTTNPPNSFRDVRVRELTKIGISEELYMETYFVARNHGDDDLCLYSDERHAEVLSERGFDKQVVLEVLDKTISEDILPTYLWSDTIEFLEALKKTGQPMILFSLGDPEFQYLKIKGSGIEKYFDRVFMDSRPKKEVMKEILDFVTDKEIWFINDRISENEDISINFPNIKVVQKISQHNTVEDYQNSGLPYFKTLTEIKNFIFDK